MNTTSEQVLADVRKEHRRRDWRWPASLAAASLGLSVVLALVLTFVRGDEQAAQIEFLSAEIAATREQLSAAQAQVEAARITQQENQRILEGVQSLVAAEGEDEARGRALVAEAIDEIVRRIQAGIDGQAATDDEIRRLVQEQADVSRRLDALLDQAGVDGAARQPAPPDPPPDAEPPPAAPPGPPATQPPPDDDGLLCGVLNLC